MKTNQELMDALFETTRFDRTPSDWRGMPETEPMEKAALKAAPVPPTKKYVLDHEAAVAGKIAAFLAAWAGKIADLMADMHKADLSMLIKAQTTASIVKDLIRKMLAQGFLIEFADMITPDLLAAARAGGLSGLALIDMAETPRMTELVPEMAVKFARQRAGDLVGMTYDEKTGKYKVNPKAEFSITDATREGIQRAVTKALKEGLSTGDVKKQLTEDYAFSKARANTIARTELATAHVQGNLKSWESSGVVKGKKWLLADTHPEFDECDEAELEETVPLDAEFEATGTSGPPAHPNCLCALTPVVERSA